MKVGRPAIAEVPAPCQEVAGHETPAAAEWLYFDSKRTTYAELSRLNERGIWFVTLRRRGANLLRQLEKHPSTDWTGAVIDIPKRRQKRIRDLDETD